MQTAIGRSLGIVEHLIRCNHVPFSCFTTQDGSGDFVVQNKPIWLSLDLLVVERIQEY